MAAMAAMEAPLAMVSMVVMVKMAVKEMDAVVLVAREVIVLQDEKEVMEDRVVLIQILAFLAPMVRQTP